MLERIDFYDDYRSFLKDYWEDRKKRFPYFSSRYFATKAGLTSPSHLNEVMHGKRKLTDKSIDSFIKGLQLNESDARYFTALVHFNQSKNPLERQQFLEIMRQLNRKVKQVLVPMDLYAYYATWYNIVLRELACLFDWKENYRILARMVRPPITTQQAREGIKFLLSSGFLRRSSSGHYEQSNPAITSGSEICLSGIRTFNKRMATRAAEAIDQFSPSERDIQSMTIGISEYGYRLIKQEMQEFFGRVARIVDDDKRANRVYNINLQMFPMSNTTSLFRKEDRHAH